MRKQVWRSACGDRHGHEMRGVTGFDAHQDGFAIFAIRGPVRRYRAPSIFGSEENSEK
jgi:hypothetical protein